MQSRCGRLITATFLQSLTVLLIARQTMRLLPPAFTDWFENVLVGAVVSLEVLNIFECAKLDRKISEVYRVPPTLLRSIQPLTLSGLEGRLY